MSTIQLTRQRRQLQRLLSRIISTDDFETFGDDERLARGHAEYFYEEYLHDVGFLP